MTKYMFISGKRYSGKDTLAAAVMKRLEYASIARKPARVALADALKEDYAGTIRNLTVDELQNGHPSGKKEIHRKALIKYGSDMRAKDIDYWCKRLQGTVEHSSKPPSVVCIPDGRYLNELEYFRKLDAILVRLEIHSSVLCSRGWTFTPGVDDHPSETQLDIGNTRPENWDIIVTHDGIKFHVYKNPATAHRQTVMDVNIGDFLSAWHNGGCKL